MSITDIELKQFKDSVLDSKILNKYGLSKKEKHTVARLYARRVKEWHEAGKEEYFPSPIELISEVRESQRQYSKGHSVRSLHDDSSVGEYLRELRDYEQGRHKIRLLCLFIGTLTKKSIVILLPIVGVWLDVISLKDINYFERSGGVLVAYGLVVGFGRYYTKEYFYRGLDTSRKVQEKARTEIDLSERKIRKVKELSSVDVDYKLSPTYVVEEQKQYDIRLLMEQLRNITKEGAKHIQDYDRSTYAWEFAILFIGTIIWCIGDVILGKV